MRKFQIAYIRVSTDLQSLERQKINISEKCPNAVFIEEKYTGTTMDRPQWNKIMQSAEGGHISDLWFDEPSRMGRTAKECFNIYKHLYFDLGIQLHFIKSSYISTDVFEVALKTIITNREIKSGDNAADKLLNTILKAIEDYMKDLIEKQIYMAFQNAENESKNLSERVKSGMANAKKKGVIFGRKKGTHYKSKKEYLAMPLIVKYYRGFGGHYNSSSVAKITGTSVRTVKKYIENIKVEQGIIDSESAKYADKKPMNFWLNGMEKYLKEAEKIWEQRYGQKMKKPNDQLKGYVPQSIFT